MIVSVSIDRNLDEKELIQFQKIIQAIARSGAAWGVRKGVAELHFGPTGDFMGINLNYRVWEERFRV